MLYASLTNEVHANSVALLFVTLYSESRKAEAPDKDANPPGLLSNNLSSPGRRMTASLSSISRTEHEFAQFGAQNHYDMLHHKQRGTVLLWEKRTDKNVWYKLKADQSQEDVHALLNGLSGNLDTYCSVNEFTGWRRIDLLTSLRACYVDLDFNRVVDHGDLDDALEHLRERQMPAPNYVVFSGRGLHFYWLLEDTDRKHLPAWQAVENALIDSLKDMHADTKARDCTRVLRLAGTVNSKNGETVHEVAFDAVPWTLDQLAFEVLGAPARKPTRYSIDDMPVPKAKVRSLDAARAARGRGINHPKTTVYRRWHIVLQDLHTIGRHYGQIPAGYRNEFLFIASVALSWFASPDSIADEVTDMAKLYCSDITEAEAALAASQSIQRATEAAGGQKRMWLGNPCDPRYHFKRHTLWERLGVLAAPVAHQLRAIITDEQAAQHEQERQSGRDRVKEGRYKDHNTKQGCRQGNADKAAQAHVLRAAGMSQSVIAVELGVSKMTVSRWCNNIAPLVQPTPPKGLVALKVNQQAGEPESSGESKPLEALLVPTDRLVPGSVSALPLPRSCGGGGGVVLGLKSAEPEDSRLALAA